ncbi:DUF6221 family protein [Streptomyces sp. NPDC018019]|uniref:DUF6221 family protein n=1 Tax=Streptomyces sp. NPDC018019 TaxID=3365030 RepID=UPI0037B0BE9C
MTDDLVAFLRARLDEDEARAFHWHGLACEIFRRIGGGLNTMVAVVAMLHEAPGAVCDCDGPARLLSDIGAKRLVLAEYEKEERVMERGHVTGWTEGGQAARLTALRAFAAVYADHPDFREEWRP